jgi:hypothetical protein
MKVCKSQIRYVMQPLQNTPLCSSTLQSALTIALLAFLLNPFSLLNHFLSKPFSLLSFLRQPFTRPFTLLYHNPTSPYLTLSSWNLEKPLESLVQLVRLQTISLINPFLGQMRGGGFSVKGMPTDGSAYVTHFVITVGPFEHSYIEQKE